jgi:Ca2+-binding EF-hand superfamily protein
MKSILIQNVFQFSKGAFLVAPCFLVLIAATGCAGTGSKPGGANGREDRFAKVDTNHDGVLDRNEVSDYIVNQIFDSRDANRDGRMTEEEWTGGDPSRLADFKKRDANHDGVVTKEEAIKYAREHGQASQIMRDADKNRDGVLSREEARDYVGDREGPPR